MPTTTRPATTVTGNMHGMSAAFLCGEPGLDGLLGDQPRASIGPDQLDLFGTRSIGSLEKKLVGDSPRPRVADMCAIDEHGVGVLIRQGHRTGERAQTAFCMSVSTWISSIPIWRLVSVPLCRGVLPIAKRIW